MKTLHHPLALALTLVPLACSAPPSADVSPPQILTDVTAESGVDFVHRDGAIGNYYVPEMMSGGVALLDYDNDNDLDLFLVQGGSFDSQPTQRYDGQRYDDQWYDSLYRNDGVADSGLRFTAVDAEQALPAASGYGMGVATGDYDGDGWIDLYITRLGSNQLLRNRGDGTFEDLTEEAGVDDSRWSVAATFFDADADGDLDLYVGNFLDFRVEAHTPCVSTAGWPDYCGPLAYQSVSDRLFRNRGDGSFEDASSASGIGAVATNTLGVVARDFDADGDLDLYLANDSQPNTLWINRGDGTFSDRAVLAGCAVNQEGSAEASMGIGTGDYDNDGDIDLFLGHLDGESNTLYELDAGGFCRDATGPRGLAVPSLGLTAFGTAMVDLDLDGWLDIAVANGSINVIEGQLQRRPRMPLAQPDRLFSNLGGEGFAEVEVLPSALADAHVSRGLAVGDLDNDGRPDLVITRVGEGPAVLINQSRENHWIGLDLRRSDGSPALGATITLRTAAGTRIATVATDGSYISAHDPRVLWGLGPTDGPVEIEVRSVGGVKATWSDLAADRYHRLTVP